MDLNTMDLKTALLANDIIIPDDRVIDSRSIFVPCERGVIEIMTCLVIGYGGESLAAYRRGFLATDVTLEDRADMVARTGAKITPEEATHIFPYRADLIKTFWRA